MGDTVLQGFSSSTVSHNQDRHVRALQILEHLNQLQTVAVLLPLCPLQTPDDSGDEVVRGQTVLRFDCAAVGLRKRAEEIAVNSAFDGDASRRTKIEGSAGEIWRPTDESTAVPVQLLLVLAEKESLERSFYHPEVSSDRISG
jgi:hypothetical protein